jgi:hypothetical protein
MGLLMDTTNPVYGVGEVLWAMLGDFTEPSWTEVTVTATGKFGRRTVRLTNGNPETFTIDISRLRRMTP